MRHNLVVIFISLVNSALFAQGSQVSDTVQVSFMYNVSILFDKPILDVPRFGSTLFIAYEKIDDRTLMLKVKGDVMLEKQVNSVPNTNMIISTADGIFNFILTFKKEPSRIWITSKEYKPIHSYSGIPTQQVREENPVITDSIAITRTIAQLDNEKVDFDGIGLIDNKLKIKMIVSNMWVDEKYNYFKIAIENLSSIPYEINYFYYFLSTEKYSLKQSTKPVIKKNVKYQLTEPENISIKPRKTFTNIIAIEKFTLAKGEYFNIQVGEVNGGRQILVPISRKDFFLAKNIQELNLQPLK
jgi:hypothetical protein